MREPAQPPCPVHYLAALLAALTASGGVAQTCPPGAVALDRGVCALTGSETPRGDAVTRSGALSLADILAITDSVAVPYDVKVAEVSEQIAEGERLSVTAYIEWTHVAGMPLYSLIGSIGPDGEVGRLDGEDGVGSTQIRLRDVEFNTLDTLVAAPGQLLATRTLSTIILTNQQSNETPAEWQACIAQERSEFRESMRQSAMAETGALSRATAPAPLIAEVGFAGAPGAVTGTLRPGLATLDKMRENAIQAGIPDWEPTTQLNAVIELLREAPRPRP